ncbi:hypothetical protein HDE69_003272 [Pedobacter cryoconitis]|uniref:Uncharacterized protein n=1 Tax=Pedobacter cryoconitis TaxID=188932 RepID=A0A7W9DKG5_9SPHI|nr:hypothetical protein [Pedobacter cryoconitis]MBB5646978.1 hypothetical protein [Pedobacter cryoconitis]
MEKQLFMVIFNGKFSKGILGDFIFKIVDGAQVVSKRQVSRTMKQFLPSFSFHSVYRLNISLQAYHKLP